MALLSLNAVRKSFGSRTVLDGLDFAIEPRARVGAVGEGGYSDWFERSQVRSPVAT